MYIIRPSILRQPYKFTLQTLQVYFYILNATLYFSYPSLWFSKLPRLAWISHNQTWRPWMCDLLFLPSVKLYSKKLNYYFLFIKLVMSIKLLHFISWGSKNGWTRLQAIGTLQSKKKSHYSCLIQWVQQKALQQCRHCSGEDTAV